MGGISSLESYESRVKAAEISLQVALQNREIAKKNGNYKNALKNYRHGNKVMNVYDHNVYNEREALKRAKDSLAEAKKRCK